MQKSSCAGVENIYPEDFKAIPILAYARTLSGGDFLFFKPWAESVSFERWQAHREFVRQPNADPKVYLPKGYQLYVPAGNALPPRYALGCFRHWDDFVPNSIKDVRTGAR